MTPILTARDAPGNRRFLDLISTAAPAAVILLSVLVAALGANAAKHSAFGDDSPGSGHPEDRYGRQLPIVGELGVGPVMDAAVVENTLYVVGRRTLYVADVSTPGSPRVVGKLAGLGLVRQIAVQDGVAYVTAREDGLYIVDVSRRQQPVLLCHYDTIELATGIAVSGDVAFVACRTCGVELVDVSDPNNPVHLSTVRTGEAQSVAARNGYLYAGVWGTSELVVCDVSNPRKPSVIAKAPLDGFGDGVDLHGNYCYVATGHHSRASPRRQEGDPGFGRGHGLEIFDVSQPAEPVFVSRIKMPLFYRIGMDMWSVEVVGRYAFVADTYNGLFVVDVSNPQTPRFVAHRQLPYVEGRDECSPAAGLALAHDHVYVAGAWSDLHTVAAPGLASTPKAEPDRAPTVPAPGETEADPRYRVYKPPGQVYGVAMSGDVALVAAGMAGLHAVELWPEINKLAQYATEGFAMDVEALEDRVYVAEGKGGMSIWHSEGEAPLRPIGRYQVEGYSIKQVVVPPPGKYALVHVGPGRLDIVDVSDPTRPARVLKDSHLGLFYSSPIADRLVEDRYACCFWHVTGFYWYDLYGGPKPVYSGDNYRFRVGSRNGLAPLKKDSLVTYRGKYFLLRRSETRPPEALPSVGIDGHDLTGKPSIFGTTLYVSDRYSGNVSAVDISEPHNPRLLDHLALPEHPGLVVVHEGVALVPAGYQGLVVWDHRRGE